MKKFVSAVTALTLSAALLAGCSANTPNPTTPPAGPNPTGTPAPAVETLKTGLSVMGSQSKSKDAKEDKAGNFQSDVTMVAVTVDANGAIVDCVIDTVQAKAAFDATGVYTFPEEVKSKIELDDEYGLRAVSSINAEWDEQAAALIDYVLGKTVEDVKGIALAEDGKPAETDLLAGCTMSIGDYIDGIVAAVESAADLGANAGDKLSVAAVTSFNAGRKDGEAQANLSISAVTTDAEGVVTSCIVDALQSQLAVDASGVITSDTSSALVSKNILGDAYGMRGASAISAEWNEQAAAFSAFVTGKTAGEIAGLAVTEDGKAADADLLAGCTLSLASFQDIVVKAIG